MIIVFDPFRLPLLVRGLNRLHIQMACVLKKNKNAS